MPESTMTFAVEPYGVDYICDQCKTGVVAYEGLSHEPFGAKHSCGECGAKVVLPDKYPQIRYRRVTASR